MDIENMTASQFKKVSPIFDKMVESSQKEVELDFKKQKAESDAELKRQSELNKLEIAQQRLASQAEINEAKLEAQKAKLEKGKELSPKQQQEAKLKVSQADTTLDKLDVLKNLLEKDKINAGNFLNSAIGTIASKTVGSPFEGGLGGDTWGNGTNNAMWDTVAKYVHLEVSQMMKGNPTESENKIISLAAGLERDLPKETLKKNLNLLIEALKEQRAIYNGEDPTKSTPSSSTPKNSSPDYSGWSAREVK
jgi:hypothetical protein